jgi:hypothetical protein
MSGKKAVAAPRPGADVRPLPAKPNLEFERKRARKLLALMRRTSSEPVKLADAQFAIAREYGFLNWPLLVRYYEELSRQEQPERPEPADRSEYLPAHPRQASDPIAHERSSARWCHRYPRSR